MSTITAAPRTAVDPAPRARLTSQAASRLGRYTESGTGAVREIVCLPLADGSALVVDRLAGTHGGARLLARLAADEPRENVQLLCTMYLSDASRGRCRPVTEVDLYPAPAPDVPAVCAVRELRDDDGAVYSIQQVALDRSFPELRWTRSVPPGHPEIVHLRDLVAQVQDYEPARTITANALAAHRSDRALSTSCLTAELTRLIESPIVLNRGLREAVQRALARDELSMSEIAMRCGRIKRDGRGNVSGETSWLARRIGELAEAGRDRPSPWVHSDVLGLIARQGLGVSPNEVEL